MSDPAKSKDMLEQEKLELEISELRAGPDRSRQARRLATVTAAMSAATTLLVAALGGWLSYWNYTTTERVHILDQSAVDQQHRTDVFEKLVTDLGSENPSSRAGAVVGLQQFAFNTSDERSAQTVELLTMQLSRERDSTVLRMIIPTLVKVGAPALPELVETNRDARSRLTALVRAAVKAGMPGFKDYAGMKDGTRGMTAWQDQKSVFISLLPSLEKSMDFSLLSMPERTAIGKVARFDPGGLGIPDIPSERSGIEMRVSDLVFAMVFGSDGTSALRDDLFSYEFGQPISSADKTVIATDGGGDVLSDASDQLRMVYLTSIVIGRLLHDGQSRQDLEGIGLLGADLSGVRLEDVDFSHAFLSGSAIGANFKGSSFFFADISRLYVAHADLSYAQFEGANLPLGGGGTFAGADWWVSTDAGRARTGETGLGAMAFGFINGKHAGYETMMCPRDESAKKYMRPKPEAGDPDDAMRGRIVVVSFCESWDFDAQPSQELEYLKVHYPMDSNIGSSTKWWSTHRHIGGG